MKTTIATSTVTVQIKSTDIGNVYDVCAWKNGELNEFREFGTRAEAEYACDYAKKNGNTLVDIPFC